MPIKYIVEDGECVASISEMYGFRRDTVWDLNENEKLRKLRGNAGTLAPGDVLIVPDKTQKEVSIAADHFHPFRRHDIPERLRIQLTNGGAPRKNIEYVLKVDDKIVTGKTDDKGWLEQPIPPGAMHGTLTVKRARTERLFDIEQDEAEVYTLNLGALPPIDTAAGIEARLRNAGFLEEAPLDEDSEALEEAMELGLIKNSAENAKDAALGRAITEFQVYHGLRVTGEIDGPTKTKLLEVHHT